MLGRACCLFMLDSRYVLENQSPGKQTKVIEVRRWSLRSEAICQQCSEHGDARCYRAIRRQYIEVSSTEVKLSSEKPLKVIMERGRVSVVEENTILLVIGR